MRLSLSPLAERDLEDIHYFGTVLFGHRQANEYWDSLLDEFKTIRAFPRAAPERLVVTPPVRLRLFQAHNILYDVGDRQVVILRVLHHSANWIDHL